MVEYLELKEKHPVRINRRVMIVFEKKTGKGLSSLSNLGTEDLTDSNEIKKESIFPDLPTIFEIEKI